MSNPYKKLPPKFHAGPNPESDSAGNGSENTGGQFHNPYHFVPVNRPADKTAPNWIEVTAQFDPRNLCHHSHASYAAGNVGEEVYSGRMICRIETETPLFIGHQRAKAAGSGGTQPVAHNLSNEKQPIKVTPFQLDGEPAIPATSLRGLISSIAEAASQSALRVLDDAMLSFRKLIDPPGQTLSAIGMVREHKLQNGSKVLKLQPLALPTLELQDQPRGRSARRPCKIPAHYAKLFPQPRFKAYIGQYEGEGEFVRDGHGFINNETRSYSEANKEWFYLKLKRDWNWDHGIGGGKSLREDGAMYVKGSRFVLAQRPLDETAVPIAEKQLDEHVGKNKERRDDYVRGILRVLGRFGKDKEDIPNNKKHEIFIPYTPEMEDEDSSKLPEIPLDVMQRFYALADQRTAEESRLPHMPQGTARNCSSDSKEQRVGLKQGDLLYFAIDNSGKIAEISFSAVWRGQVRQLPGQGEAATVHQFFQGIDTDSDLLPFHEKRKWVSPAELMFGFVEMRPTPKPEPDWRRLSQIAAQSATATVQKKAGRAFAGKVRISFGRLAPGQPADHYLPEVTLKILSSPKPPSPSFYFKGSDGTGTHIPKSQLNPTDHRPQGRKMYLHALRDNGKIAPLTPLGETTKLAPESANKSFSPWESITNRWIDADRKNEDQKARITPVKEGRIFLFHVDFDNLSKWELSLLCYALRPNAAFRHKLGMGKPIGLGTIRIDPVGLFVVNRAKRYKEDNLFDDPRYHERWITADSSLGGWEESYLREAASKGDCAFDPHTLAAECEGAMEPSVAKALKTLGDPSKVSLPVHYPQVAGAEIEKETYKWFVANDIGSGRKRDPDYLPPKGDYLDPLVNRDDLPPLSRLPFNE